jgi:hypothetical protein
MSEAAAALGTPFEFVYDGVTLKVGPRDLDVETAMSRTLASRDFDTIRRFADKLTKEEYAQQISDWRRTVSTGVWDYGSPEFVRFYNTTAEGLKISAFLQLKKHNPSLSRELIDRVWDDDNAWLELVEKLAAANADPTKRAVSTT